MRISAHQITDAAIRLFNGTDERNAIRLLPLADTLAAPVIEGVLYELPMKTPNHQPVVVRLYLDIGDVGGELWTQEVKAMLRFSSVSHPALPRIRDGNVRILDIDDQPVQAAYVVADRFAQTLADVASMSVVQKNKTVALTQLANLVDGIRILHSAGLAHRNIAPDTIEIAASPSSSSFDLRLSRFEMSGLESNLLRRLSSAGIDSAAEAYRKHLIDKGPTHLAYMPPERLTSLFATDRAQAFPEYRSGDVFSLGMLAYVWFVRDLDEIALQNVFPMSEDGTLRYDSAAHAAMLDALGTHLRTDTTVAPQLRDLIAAMLRDSPRTRRTAFEVIDTLSRRYEELSGWYGSESESRSYTVAVKPDEFRWTAFKWGWITEDPATDEGLDSLRAFIQDDLKGGVIEYCHGGWASVRNTDHSEDRRAQIVLCGKRAAYFGHLFEHRLVHEERGAGAVLPQVVFIRQMLDLSGGLAAGYQRPIFRRRLPSIRVVPWTDPELIPSRARQYPSWQALIDAVRIEVPRPPEYKHFEDALRFFLAVQQVEVDARQYPFRREGPAPVGTGEVTLVYDAERDEQRTLQRALLHLFCQDSARRPAFGDYFAYLEDQGLENTVVFKPQNAAVNSSQAESSGTASVVAWEGVHRIRIRVTGDSIPVPSEGWLEPESNRAARTILSRQRDAFSELLEHPALLGQLIKPHSLFEPSRAPESAAEEFEVAVGVSHRNDSTEPETKKIKRLRGKRSREVVRELLGCSPMYALQGPPGTGKTTIAARAVRSTLLSDPSIRILVSAQSHYALDNFAATVLEYVPALASFDPDMLGGAREMIGLRVASQATETKVTDPAVAALLPKNLRKRLEDSILARCSRRLRRGEDDKATAELLEGWRTQVPTLMPEIIDRVRRGANVVFSTCGTATEDEVGSAAGIGDYDWVLIEEAAKAWPTELLIPMVRGSRWTLIGDQRQLSAYRLNEVMSLLDACANGPESLQVHFARKAEYERVFKLFDSFFRSRSGSPGVTATQVMHAELSDERQIIDRPVNMLNMQFRMAPPIAEVVSIFYDEALTSGPGTDAPHDIDVFAGLSVVWVDTGDEVNHRCEPCWYNEGETDTIRRLLIAIDPLAKCKAAQAEGRIAILSPYRDQVDLLKERVPDRYRERVHTIDSFQGREAEIVVVSLVRRRGGYAGKALTSRLGHLVSEQRINVMLSRAKRLLVIVGDMEHFDHVPEQHETSVRPFWPLICNAVRKGGSKVTTEQLFNRLSQKGRHVH